MSDPPRPRGGIMRSEGHSIAAIADSVAGTFPGCEDASASLSLVRELSRGEPVSTSALAAVTGRAEPELRELLARWPTVQRDEHGRVVAFSGLSLRPAAHGIDVAGRRLHAWCA